MEVEDHQELALLEEVEEKQMVVEPFEVKQYFSDCSYSLIKF